MAQIQPELSPHTAALSALEAGGYAGSKWSFVYLATSHGGQVAKEAFIATVSTVGVIDALLLSFAVPALAAPPASLVDGEHEQELRLWFWFTFMSVAMGISSVILATIILTFCTPVPKEGVAEYLTDVHLPFTIMAAAFIVAIMMQGAAQLTTVNSYVSATDFWAAVAVLLAVYGTLILYFFSVDKNSRVKNQQLFDTWSKEHQQCMQGKGKGTAEDVE